MSSWFDGTWTSVLNVAVLGAVAYSVINILWPRSNTNAREEEEKKKLAAAWEETNKLPQREFTLQELSQYNGNPVAEHPYPAPIYLAINGTVFDVSKRPDFYGPKGSYGCFAGKDASRGLATSTFVTSEEWDDLANLDKPSIKSMTDWFEFFSNKYPVRGKLVRSHAAGST
eukprot:m.140183 g.140183  ORF g.140183 m.140183 type:complete len:171 (-) comp52567_c0_seq1:129-641(-)